MTNFSGTRWSTKWPIIAPHSVSIIRNKRSNAIKTGSISESRVNSPNLVGETYLFICLRIVISGVR